ncbi:MAG: hypothetical protein AAB462_00640 [Patescibacteria group bacterium]
MNWLRKGFVGLLSIVLLLCLFGIAASTNIVRNLGQPTQIESWLSDSKIYDNVMASVLQQSKEEGSSNSASVSPSDPQVSAAAIEAFSPELIQQSVSTFLASNYAWLNGKTDKPDFVIDLSDAKQNFANKVGEAVYQNLSTVPVCTPTQLAQIQLPANPLTVTCRPAELNAQTESARVTEEISNGDFLSKPLITADTIGQGDQATPSKPYYEKLSIAPKIFKFAVWAPLILTALAILIALGVVFLSRDRRRGTRRVGIIALEVGVILIAAKFAADYFTNKFEDQILKGSAFATGQLKQPTSDFIHKVESELVLLNLLFGILFVVIALIIFGILFKTRAGSSKPKPRAAAPREGGAGQPEEPQPQPALAPRTPLQPRQTAPPTTDLANRLKPKPVTKPAAPKGLGKTPPRRKPPRLVQ